MKKPLFKSIVLLSAALAIFSCSDEVTDAINQAKDALANTNQPGAEDPAWLLDAGQPILIYQSGIVTDANGTVIGTFVPAAEGSTVGNIVAVDGNNIVENVDTSLLQVTTRSAITPTTPVATSSDASLPGISSETLPGVSSASLPAVSSASVPAQSSNSNVALSSTAQQVTSSAAQQQTQSSAAVSGNCDGKCFDSVSGKCVEYYAEQTGSKGEKYAYDNSCNVKCYYDPDNKDCKNISGAAPASSNSQQQQQQPKSSSSQQQQQQQQPKSSSSQQQWQQPSSSSVKSSSSQQQQQQQQQQQGGSLLPKVVSGAQVKSGYATRYWDSCKPHCAWKGKGGPVARTCNTNGTSTASADDMSVCDGGTAGTCFDQTPQIVNDTIAYAFAATPGGGNDCGKCYMLTFKGTGASATSTPTDSHHRAIKGKHLIVMSNNIGYDVSHNQFDLMIPGGGPGAFNGCGKMGISCAGAQYGGFLTTCNYKKDCLINMCNKEYANNTSLKNGCLFLANWMDAANNPEVDFVEVECPQALKAKY